MSSRVFGNCAGWRVSHFKGALKNLDWQLLEGRHHVLGDRVAEKAMAPHSSTLAWKIPWMEEPGRLQSMQSLRVGHDRVCFSGEGNGTPLQYSCLENPMDRGA